MAKRPQGEECAIILEFTENLGNTPLQGGPVHDPTTKGSVVLGEECAVIYEFNDPAIYPGTNPQEKNESEKTE